jgi:hypothetical protein
MNAIKISNLILAFVLELLALIILSYWGFSLPLNPSINILLGIAVPIVLILVWGRWCAPKSPYRLVGIHLFLPKSLIFIGVVWCLIQLHFFAYAFVFAFFVILHLGISSYFKIL